jgi:hypothetical protein
MNNQATSFDITNTALQPVTNGRYFDATGKRIILPFSYTELERARRFALRLLNSFHFRTGNNILITALLDQVVQLMPVERAIYAAGLVLVSADSSIYDAKRVESIIRRFELSAAINITSATLDGLEQLGHDPKTLFSGLTVWAAPCAYDRLIEYPETSVMRYMEIGPAIAMECPYKNGAHIDRFEWQVEAIDGELVLSSRVERCAEFSQYRTGTRGVVHHGSCQCGNPDPRVILSD